MDDSRAQRKLMDVKAFTNKARNAKIKMGERIKWRSEETKTGKLDRDNKRQSNMEAYRSAGQNSQRAAEANVDYLNIVCFGNFV